MVFPETPPDVTTRVKSFFRSDNRRKIAMEFMFYDHWPTGEERQEIATRYGVDPTTVAKTLYVLRDKDLFTKDQGSIPLYRARLKAENVVVSVDDGVEPLTVPEGQILEDEEVVPDSVENIEERGRKAAFLIDNEPEDPHKDRMDAFDARIHGMGEKLDTFISEIRTSIKQVSVTPPKDNPGHVIDQDNPELTQPESVEGHLERVERLLQESDERDPFDDLNREQIIELIRSQPQELMTMANPGGKVQGGRVEGQPVTLRPMILMLTTYSQMLYERAVYDGYFKGTLSDFANFTMEQYFTDRGWGLDWNKREPANRRGRLG